MRAEVFVLVSEHCVLRRVHRKAGYDAVRRAEAERQRQREEKERQERQAKAAKAQAAAQSAKPHGSWGPVFKNRDHFASMHMC